MRSARLLDRRPRRLLLRSTEELGEISLWVVLGTVFGLAALGGYAFDRHEHQQLQQEVSEYLTAVSSLKTREIEAWLAERNGDAIIAGRLPVFSHAVTAHLAGEVSPETDVAALVQAFALRKTYRYSEIFLLSTDGKLLTGTDLDPESLTGATQSAVRAALDAGAPRFSDLWIPYQGASPLLDLAAPVHGMDTDADRVIGVVVLRIDPRLVLWPLLAAWPDATHDGRLALLRQERGAWTLFDVTRAAAGDVIGPRRIQLQPDSVYAQVAQGSGTGTGSDEAGQSLLASAHGVPVWPWTLVATIPLASVDARAGHATLQVMGWIVVVLGGAALLARRHARRLSDGVMRASEERLRISQALAHAGSWEWNPRARSFAFSAELTRILGLPPEPPPSPRRMLRQVPAAERRALLRALRATLRDGKRASLEHDVRRSDGRLRSVQHEANRYAAKTEFELRIVGVILDVSERRQVERALRESEAVLEKRQAELIAAREAALQAARVKARFLANVSHEIRTPLNAIVGLSHLLSLAALPPRERDQVQKIRASARNLLDLINDVLDFSKLEAGKLQVESAPFQLDELLDAVANMVAVEAQQKGLQLSFALPEGVPIGLVGDALRLRQVLTNLTHNAVKFTHSGEVAVGVELRERSAERARLRFSVRDTGIGIHPDELPKLFVAFTQADDSTTRRFGGTGLGLAISSELVQLMGGQIEVQSALGAGSTFCFVLEFPLGAARRGVPAAPGAPPLGLKGARVLVAEDNEINQQVACQLLESAGVEVTLVRTGLEALSAATAPDARYDAVLMDLQMPELDGVQATRAIRAHPRGAALPIIAMTAHTLELERERCVEAGMNAHVAKPVDPAQLYATLAQWVRPAQSSAAESEALIPGIDFETALRRVRNNRRLLLRLLAELARTWRDGGARIRQHLAQAESEAARRAAHTLGGAASNLGADTLAAAARRVERALATEEPASAQAAIDELEAVLQSVCSALDERLPRLSA